MQFCFQSPLSLSGLHKDASSFTVMCTGTFYVFVSTSYL